MAGAPQAPQAEAAEDPEVLVTMLPVTRLNAGKPKNGTSGSRSSMRKSQRQSKRQSQRQSKRMSSARKSKSRLSGAAAPAGTSESDGESKGSSEESASDSEAASRASGASRVRRRVSVSSRRGTGPDASTVLQNLKREFDLEAQVSVKRGKGAESSNAHRLHKRPREEYAVHPGRVDLLASLLTAYAGGEWIFEPGQFYVRSAASFALGGKFLIKRVPVSDKSAHSSGQPSAGMTLRMYDARNFPKLLPDLYSAACAVADAVGKDGKVVFDAFTDMVPLSNKIILNNQNSGVAHAADYIYDLYKSEGCFDVSSPPAGKSRCMRFARNLAEMLIAVLNIPAIFPLAQIGEFADRDLEASEDALTGGDTRYTTIVPAVYPLEGKPARDKKKPPFDNPFVVVEELPRADLEAAILREVASMEEDKTGLTRGLAKGTALLLYSPLFKYYVHGARFPDPNSDFTLALSILLNSPVVDRTGWFKPTGLHVRVLDRMPESREEESLLPRQRQRNVARYGDKKSIHNTDDNDDDGDPRERRRRGSTFRRSASANHAAGRSRRPSLAARRPSLAGKAFRKSTRGLGGLPGSGSGGVGGAGGDATAQMSPALRRLVADVDETGLGVLFDETARECVKRAKQSPSSSIQVLWDGQPGSTAMLIALLELGPELYRKERVFMNVVFFQEAVDRFEAFYQTYLGGGNKGNWEGILVPSLWAEESRGARKGKNAQDEHAKLLLEDIMDLGNKLVVTSEHCDEIFGSPRHIFPMSHRQETESWDAVVRSRVRETRLVKDDIVETFIKQLKHHAELCPFEIKTMRDYSWWISFTCRWQFVSTRMMLKQPELNSEQANNLFHFYRGEQWQVWAMSPTHHRKHKLMAIPGKDKPSYLALVKAYICHKAMPNVDSQACMHYLMRDDEANEGNLCSSSIPTFALDDSFHNISFGASSHVMEDMEERYGDKLLRFLR